MSPRRGRRRGGWARRLTTVAALAAAGLGWVVLAKGPERREEVVRAARAVLDPAKRVSAADFLGDVVQLYVLRTGQVAGVKPGEADRLPGVPVATAFRHGAVTVLENEGFAVGYAETLRAPVWATYRVRDLDRPPPRLPRPDSFEVDRRTRARVSPEAYIRSGFDRGHLAPNFAIGRQYGERAQRQTFLMSNIVPQRRALNSGAWRELEARLAVNYPSRFREVAVICGPIFGENPARLPSGVAVPEAFFMLVVDQVEDRLRAVAVRLPQEAAGDGSGARWSMVAIDRIERETGFDFLAELGDDFEASLEARAISGIW